MIHEKARTIDPDLADAELAIFQFLPVDHDQRHLKIHVATDVTLFCYEELDTRVAETYADWEIVLAEREQEARRAGGQPGTLI